MKISAIITLKKDVLDPQGKAVHQALNGIGFDSVKSIRQGKYFEIEIDEKDENKAERKIDEMCQKLLVNLIIEDYKISRFK